MNTAPEFGIAVRIARPRGMLVLALGLCLVAMGSHSLAPESRAAQAQSNAYTTWSSHNCAAAAGDGRSSGHAGRFRR